jgi:hypothetical protein
MNGPVPTGLGSVNVAGFTVDQMCSGTMNVCAIRNRFANSGWLNFSTAVFASGAVALSGTGVPSVVRPLLCLIMLKVKATSAALNGLPSFHCTLGRVLRVSVLPSADQL